MDDKLQEIIDFWRKEIHEYDDIVTVREIAFTDIYDLIKIVQQQQKQIQELESEIVVLKNVNNSI